MSYDQSRRFAFGVSGIFALPQNRDGTIRTGAGVILPPPLQTPQGFNFNVERENVATRGGSKALAQAMRAGAATASGSFTANACPPEFLSYAQGATYTVNAANAAVSFTATDESGAAASDTVLSGGPTSGVSSGYALVRYTAADSAEVIFVGPNYPASAYTVTGLSTTAKAVGPQGFMLAVGSTAPSAGDFRIVTINPVDGGSDEIVWDGFSACPLTQLHVISDGGGNADSVKRLVINGCRFNNIPVFGMEDKSATDGIEFAFDVEHPDGVTDVYKLETFGKPAD